MIATLGRNNFYNSVMKGMRSVSAGISAIYVLLGAHLWGLPRDAHGDEWSITPSVQIKASYDDNINLSPDSPIAVWGGTFSPLVDLASRTANSSYGLGGRLIFNRYSEESVQDTNVQLLTFNARTATRLSRFSLPGAYKRDSTFTSVQEPQADEDEDSVDVDAGLVRIQVRRNRLSLKPSWAYAMTEITSVKLGYSLNDTTYSGDGSASLTDYRRQVVDMTFMRNWSRNTQLNAAISGGRYEASNGGTNTDDYGITVGFRHDFSPMLRAVLGVGVRTAISTIDEVEVESAGTLFNASLIKKYSELTTYRLMIGQSLQPSGSGVLVLNENLRGMFAHDISAKLSISVWGTAFRNQSLDLFSAANDRVYYDFEPGFRWMLTPLWSIDGSYRYRWQKYDSEDDEAIGNATYLAFNYAWPRMAASR